MSVYVDLPIHSWRGMKWCHVWTDGEPEELHKFVEQIGLKRSWYQCPPKASWCHYDTIAKNRLKLIKLGAIATDKYGALEHVAKSNNDTKTLEKIEKCRKLFKQF